MYQLSCYKKVRFEEFVIEESTAISALLYPRSSGVAE